MWCREETTREILVKNTESRLGPIKLESGEFADRIYPVLFQEGLRLPLTKILRAGIVLGHMPMAWGGSRVVFLPKPGELHRSQGFQANQLDIIDF